MRHNLQIRKTIALFIFIYHYFTFTVKKDYKIEEQNNINVNLFGYENRQPYPIYVSKEKFENELNLLSITDCENKHYVLIKDFNMPIYHKTKHQHRKNFCMYCFDFEIIREKIHTFAPGNKQ